MRILIFDSGSGGLPVLYTLRQRFPNIDYRYVSDTAHMPYGTRGRADIENLVRKKLTDAGETDLAILACNTVTAAAAESLRKTFPYPIYGVEPAVKPALNAHADDFRPVTLLCTPATAREKRWRDKRIKPVTLGGLAGEIERELRSAGKISDALIKRVASRCPEKDVILGCTHYTFLAPGLKNAGFTVYDGGEGLTANVMRACKNTGSGRLEFSDGKEEELYRLLIDKGALVGYTV